MNSKLKTSEKLAEAERAHRARIENLRAHLKKLKFKTRVADRTVMAAGRLLQGSWPVQP